ncbi:MAG: hypothetical protein JXR72_07435 [Proteobacteria bacterium]|nr:hypothetical protein [Pseudomonadota bacterium]
MDRLKTYRIFLTLGDLILLALAAFLVSGIITSLMVPIPDAVGLSSRSQKGPIPLPARETAADTEIILKRNLFGSRVVVPSPSPRAVAEEDMEDLPESSLPLTLLGTAVNVQGEKSLAVILNKDTREEQVYAVGDTVTGGAVLSSVARNRVVLLRDGQEEILEKTEEESQSARTSTPERTRPERARPSGPSPGEDASVTVRKTGEDSYVMDRREVEGVLQDFNKLLTQIRVVPHFTEGNPDGFKIFNIRPGSFFSQLGMVNGDIIKRVNGLEISGPEQALQMFTQLRDESRVTVDLERFRKNLTLQYEIR